MTLPSSRGEWPPPTALQLSEAFAREELSPVDATEDALAAIDAYDAAVNAFVLVDRDGARRAARASAERWRSGSPLGRFDGVPTPVKDVLLTAGWPTLKGSTLIDEAGPWQEDSPVVTALRAAGCVLLGKTATPEFAWKAVTDSRRCGVTGNPWDPAMTPGGSSGGSAAAVALGMGTWSVGTDGGGSVRIPAGFTGTVAFKPSYGVVPHYPASAFGSLAHTGPMTRTVSDAAALLDMVAVYDPRDWGAAATPAVSFADGMAGPISNLRVAFSANLGFVDNDPDVERLVADAVCLLADAGAMVTEVDPGFADPVHAFHTLWFAGAAKVLEGYSAEQLGSIDPLLRECAEIGASLSASQYLDAEAARAALGREMGRFHQDYDVLLTPTLPIPAFPAGQDVPDGWSSPWWTCWTPYTYPFNMTGQPALSVPCGVTGAGLPVGLQIVGARQTDAMVLRVGRAYQDRSDWHTRPPRLIEKEDH
jgi:aspartyl-tRNA(Asn)/glutamyl-tRNA(Gln) amidotransferase subunit A